MGSRDPNTFYDFFAINDNQNEDSTTMVSLTQGLNDTTISNQNLEQVPPAEQWSSWAYGSNPFPDFSGNNDDDTPFELTSYSPERPHEEHGSKAHKEAEIAYKKGTWKKVKNKFSKIKGKKQELYNESYADEELVQPTLWDIARDQNKAPLQSCDDHGQQVNSPWDQQGKLKYKGIYWTKKSNTFGAAITWGREKFHLGSYPTAVQAALARDQVCFRMHGPDDADKLNFPQHVNLDSPTYQAPHQETPITYGGPIPVPGTSEGFYNTEGFGGTSGINTVPCWGENYSYDNETDQD